MQPGHSTSLSAQTSTCRQSSQRDGPFSTAHDSPLCMQSTVLQLIAYAIVSYLP